MYRMTEKEKDNTANGIIFIIEIIAVVTGILIYLFN